MKNWEKYEEEIKAFGINSFAMTKNGEAVECSNKILSCDSCAFGKNEILRSCYKKKIDWLYKEYEEPKIDWSKIPVDTPIYVRNEEGQEWSPRHFAGIDNKGRVIAWSNGKTSFTQQKNYAPCPWEYAKLAEDANERD